MLLALLLNLSVSATQPPAAPAFDVAGPSGGWNKRQWKKRANYREEVAAELRQAWQGLQESPQAAKAVKIAGSTTLEPMEMGLTQIRELINLWHEQAEADDEEFLMMTL